MSIVYRTWIKRLVRADVGKYFSFFFLSSIFQTVELLSFCIGANVCICVWSCSSGNGTSSSSSSSIKRVFMCSFIEFDSKLVYG